MKLQRQLPSLKNCHLKCFLEVGRGGGLLISSWALSLSQPKVMAVTQISPLFTKQLNHLANSQFHCLVLGPVLCS